MEILTKGKKLAFLLRHQPDLADKAGWVDVSIICRELQITQEQLQEIVKTNNKQRFEFSEDTQKIRARQGHSIPVELNYIAVKPPTVLLHGTALKFKDSILKYGILKQNRHAVHLTENTQIALLTGLRHGDPIIIEVEALKMHEEGYKFFLTENNVWLTEHVPPQYLKCISK